MAQGLGEGSWDGAWEFGLGDLISAEQRGTHPPQSERPASINTPEQAFAPWHSPHTASSAWRPRPGVPPQAQHWHLLPCSPVGTIRPHGWWVPGPHQPLGRVINGLALPTGPPQVRAASLSHQPPIPAALIPSLGTRSLPPPHL